MKKDNQMQQLKQSTKIYLEFYCTFHQSNHKYQFPPQILKFNIELLNNNHDEPYPIPCEIVDSQYPFDIMVQFLDAHNYDPKGFKLIKPINSKNYADLVDQITFNVCQQFTLPQNAQRATQVVNLCRFLRFHQLHDAVCAAIATNYYIPPNNEAQLNEFRKTHKIDQLSPQEICQVIKEYEEIFSMIETKAKEDFLKTGQQSPSNTIN